MSLAIFVDGNDGLTGEDRGGADGTTKAIPPERLTGRAVHADRHPSVGCQVKPTVMIQRRRNVGDAARLLPDQVGIRDVAHTVGANAEDLVFTPGRRGVDAIGPAYHRVGRT